MSTQELIENKLKLYIRNFHYSDNIFEDGKHCPLCNRVLNIRLNANIVDGENTEIYVDEYKCHSCVLQHSIIGSTRRENDPIKEYALIYKSNIFSGDDFCAKHRKDILVTGLTAQRVKEFMVWKNSKPVVGPVITYLAKDCNGRPTYVGYDASIYKFEDAFIAMTDFNLPYQTRQQV